MAGESYDHSDLYLYSSNGGWLVENNVFESSEVGTQVYTRYWGGGIFRYNEVRNGTVNSAVYMAAGGADRVQVYGNWFHTYHGSGYMLVVRNADPGCGAGQPTDVLVHSNVFGPAPGRQGLGAWRSSGYYFYNNTFYDLMRAIYLNPDGQGSPNHNVEIYNNLFHTVTTAVYVPFSGTSGCSEPAGWFMDYNHFYDVEEEIGGGQARDRITLDHRGESNGPDNTYGDPGFITAGSPYLRLSSDSASLIDTGTLLLDDNVPTSMEVDFDGEPRLVGVTLDRGAFEYPNPAPGQDADTEADAGVDAEADVEANAQDIADFEDNAEATTADDDVRGDASASTYAGDENVDPGCACATRHGARASFSWVVVLMAFWLAVRSMKHTRGTHSGV